MGAAEGKKSENLGGPAQSGSCGGAPKSGAQRVGPQSVAPRQIPLLAQTSSGSNHFWPDFGTPKWRRKVTTFGPLQILPLLAKTSLAVSGVCALKGGAPKGGALKGGAPKGRCPERWGPEGWGTKGSGTKNFALFVPSPATIFILFPSLGGVVPWNFGGVIEGWDPQTCTFQGPSVSKTPPKFNETTPKRRKKNGRGKNKSEILGGPAEGGPAEGGSGGGGVGGSAQILDAHPRKS